MPYASDHATKEHLIKDLIAPYEAALLGNLRASVAKAEQKPVTNGRMSPQEAMAFEADIRRRSAAILAAFSPEAVAAFITSSCLRPGEAERIARLDQDIRKLGWSPS